MRKLLTALLAGFALLAFADTTLIPDMKFRRLDAQNGLSSSQVNCILKDSRGYVWIGTAYGLNRYDGYRFKTFYSNVRDTLSMRDNYTDEIYEAYDGKLWLKQGMNYCVYDPVTETFERSAQRELEKMGVHCGGIERLYIDSKKRFWVKGYDQAIYCHHPQAKRDKTVKIRMGYGVNEYKPTYGISTFAELGDWLVVATNTGELVCLNGEKGEVDWEDRWMREHGSPENQEYRLHIDKDENIWCEVLEHTFVREKGGNKWYNSINEYFEAHGVVGIPSPLMVWDLAVDSRGWVWLACDHEALIVVDVKSGQWKQFKNSRYDETSISENTLRHLYLTGDGSVWIGTYKTGINQYVPGLSSLTNIELGDINTVCEDKYGNYWLGTNDQGVMVYDPKTGEVVAHYTKDNSGLYGNIVVGSWAASDGTIWFGSYNGGLTHCIPSAGNPAQATLVNYQATGQPGGLANNNVWDLTEDKWGRIWFSTLGGGLQMLDPKTGQFSTWDSKNSAVPSDYMTSVGWTKKGWLMVGTSYYYSLVNPVSRKLAVQYLPEDPSITVNISNTSYIIEDSRGLIWQGSTSGLTVYDPKTKFITLIDMTKGLFGSGINSIVEDKKHTIWAITEHGVSSIVPLRQDDGTWQFNIRSFSSRDGLQKATYNQRSARITRDGLLLVGGQGGLDIIDPSKLTDTRSHEKPVFSGLQIFDQDVAVGKEINGRVILDEALNTCRHLDLRFNDQFTIQLATDQVVVNNHKRFAYKLEGFNENWVKTSELNPNITYNSLRAGSYTLCVRVLNDDGTLGEAESQLTITIHPPLWRTRWMILLYMLFIAAVAWWWRRSFLRRQEERMNLEQLRRETEKKHWMSEMRRKMEEELKSEAEQPQVVTNDEEPVIVDEADAQSADSSPLTIENAPQQRTDLVALFREECDRFAPPVGKNIKLSYFPFADKLEVMGNQQLLRQMLQILLANAVAFSPSNSKVKVFVEQQRDKALIRVADSGVGIPDAVKPHLFEEIISDDDSPNLHVVFDIVSAHHGTIKADENHGGGTVFTIELPCAGEIQIEDAVIVEDE